MLIMSTSEQNKKVLIINGLDYSDYIEQDFHIEISPDVEAGIICKSIKKERLECERDGAGILQVIR